jgi:hypothetical protein
MSGVAHNGNDVLTVSLLNSPTAGFLNWGWQAGCDFVGKTCLDFAAANPTQQYFCTREQYADTVNTVCTFDGLARAKCEDAQFADGCTMKVGLAGVQCCLLTFTRVAAKGLL